MSTSASPVGPRERYHHGNLRNALVAAGVQLAREGGPAAIGLRAAARAVGVSATAAYRHFSDHAQLVAAVRGQGRQQMAGQMRRELAAVPAVPDGQALALARFRAIGRGYVRFARAEPGLFRTAFLRYDGAGLPDGGAEDPSPGPYQLLLSGLGELVAAGVLPPGQLRAAEIGSWSAVHGLSVLIIDGPLAAAGAQAQDCAIEDVLDVVGLGRRWSSGPAGR